MKLYTIMKEPIKSSTTAVAPKPGSSLRGVLTKENRLSQRFKSFGFFW